MIIANELAYEFAPKRSEPLIDPPDKYKLAALSERNDPDRSDSEVKVNVVAKTYGPFGTLCDPEPVVLIQIAPGIVVVQAAFAVESTAVVVVAPEVTVYVAVPVLRLTSSAIATTGAATMARMASVWYSRIEKPPINLLTGYRMAKLIQAGSTLW